ncbi:MAG: hypothetical protein Q9227_006189 [Pyrenula ochraceoflavens]
MAKTSYFSSVYSFGPKAVDDARNGMQDFVTYDQDQHIFSMKSGNGEEVQDFITSLRRVIDREANKDPTIAQLQHLNSILQEQRLHNPLQQLKDQCRRQRLNLQESDDEPDGPGEELPHDNGIDWGALSHKRDLFRLPTRRDNHRFELCAIRRNFAARRVLLENGIDPTILFSKHVSQLRSFGFEGLSTPANFEKQVKIHKGAKTDSSLWLAVPHGGLGKGKAKQASRDPHLTTKQATSEEQSVEVYREQSHYLTPEKNQRVNEWAGKVDPYPGLIGLDASGPSKRIDQHASPAKVDLYAGLVNWDPLAKPSTELPSNEVALTSAPPLWSYDVEGLIPAPKEPGPAEPPSELQASLTPSHHVSAAGGSGSSSQHMNSEVVDDSTSYRSHRRQGLEHWEKRVAGQKPPVAGKKVRRVKIEDDDDLQIEDEVSTRKFHSTMNQRAPKPTPGKKKGRPADLAAAKKREAILNDSWGNAASKPSTSRPSQNPTNPLPEANNLRSGHNTIDGEQVRFAKERDAAALRFAAELLPGLSAAKSFPGSLQLIVEIGQVLITGKGGQGALLSGPQDTVHEIKEWDQLFYARSSNMAFPTMFTNLVTTDGRDVDYMLDLSYHDKQPSIDDPFAGRLKLFNSEPTEISTSYEFHCHSKGNQRFILSISPADDLNITSPPIEPATINVHHLAQIWDTRLLLTGAQPFVPNDALDMAINELRENLYVPSGKTELEVYFRRPAFPASNEINIDAVFCKRQSKHACFKHPDILLVPTQIQRLSVRSKASDPSSCCAFAMPYADMADSGTLHWKVSLESKTMNNKLRENISLKPGEAPRYWTPESLLFADHTAKAASDPFAQLLDTADLVLKQIDSVGASNYGTLARVLNAAGSVVGDTALGVQKLGLGAEPRGGRMWWQQKNSDSEPVKPDESASQVGGRGKTVMTHWHGGTGKRAVDTGEFW